MKVAFRDCCAKCGADLHACSNCEHFDAGAYNQCHEPQAERVVDKERSNLCEYFKAAKRVGKTESKKGQALAALEGLFKKG